MRGLMLTGVAALGLAAWAAPANAALTAVSPNTIAVGPDAIQLPQYYDDGAAKLTVCPVGDVNCGAITDYVPPAGEAFYNRAVAKIDGPNGEVLTMVIAVEAAFDPTFTSTPVTFTRIRSKIQGGVGNSTYNVVEPFGTQVIQTNAAGTGVATDQVGCVIAAADTPCDFSVALGGGMTNWLRWDPAVPPAAPAGYVGDGGATNHAITGSPNNTNFFQMSGPGIGTLSTDQFAVTGKLFDNTVPAFGASPVSFAGQRVGTSATKTATIRNDGAVAMNVTGVTVAGPNAADFSIVPGTNTCTAGPVAANSSCSVDVTFSPSATGGKSASLSVASDAPGSPHGVALSGIGTASLLAASPAGVGYGTQIVGTTTAPRTVTLSNNGSAPLNVGAVSIGGAAPGDYTLGLNTCGAAVAPNASCSVDVFFTPGAVGVRNASLSIASDGGNSTVALSGTGLLAQPATAGGAGAGAGAATGTTAGTGAAAATGTAPGDVAAGSSARPALVLKSIGMATRIKQSKAQKSGLRMTLRLPDGTEIVKINVYRKIGTTAKILSSGLRAPSTAAQYAVTLNQPALRRLLKKGNYEVRVTPGYSKSELGQTTKASFKVV
jgi:hypothetical protein